MKGIDALPNGKFRVRYRNAEGASRSKTFSSDEFDTACEFKRELDKAK